MFLKTAKLKQIYLYQTKNLNIKKIKKVKLQHTKWENILQHNFYIVLKKMLANAYIVKIKYPYIGKKSSKHQPVSVRLYGKI